MLVSLSLQILLYFLHPIPTLVSSFNLDQFLGKPATHSALCSHTSTPTADPKPGPVHYFELTKPHQSDHLVPTCTLSLSLLTSKTARYSPPSGCSAPWSHVALHVQASRDQSSRQFPPKPLPPHLNNDVATLWLNGSELIRMSPPHSTQHGLGVSWEVRKDVTRYASLLEISNLSLTLTSLRTSHKESLSACPSSYPVNISIFYYDYMHRSPSLESSSVGSNMIGEGEGDFYDPPPDLVMPLSNKNHDHWFRIENEFDVCSVGLEVPSNTIRAMLELYVSSHSDDEFWPSHLPDSMLRRNNFSSKHKPRAFKEVFVTIDGKVVGSEVPFPVIFPGSINPLFWEPIVAIGAFDHPTHDIDLTPFLESMIDGETHEFGIGVSRSSPFWLVSGNLHIWLDHQTESAVIEARSVLYHYPALRTEQKSELKGFERRLELKAKRKSKFIGWVLSSKGNFTTRVSQETELKNSIRFNLSGHYIKIENEIVSEREVRVETETGELADLVTMKRKYPMSILSCIMYRPRLDKSTYSGSANVTMKEKLVRGKRSRVYHNNQYTSGWMLVTDEKVVSGSARTEQRLKYRDGVGAGGCCIREAAAEKGRLLKDDSSFLCSPPSSS